MTFEDNLTALATRAPQIIEQLETEEATKNALVMPFIQALGYNVFDPTEVVPEFSADVGSRRGEKVDYAIIDDGKPILLFECKTVGADLKEQQVAQLFRYFTVTDVRIGILTDGITYQFFSDIEERNKMDLKPFLEVDLLNLNGRAVRELKRFAKQSFDLDKMLEAAVSLKYTRAIKQVFSQQLNQPDDEFVRWIARQVYSGTVTQSVREQFSVLTKQALNEFINDRINATLKTALDRGSDEAESQDIAPSDEVDTAGIDSIGDPGPETTVEETEAYLIIKALLRDKTDITRVAMRDAKTYCSVLLDDNNRKLLCRLHFNRSQKYIGLFDEQKHEERHAIDSLDEIFQFAVQIKATVSYYDS